jgi:hypothetical protein
MNKVEGLTPFGIKEDTPIEEADYILQSAEAQLDERIVTDMLTLGAIWHTRKVLKIYKRYAPTFKEYCKQESKKSYETINNLINIYLYCNPVAESLEGVSYTKLAYSMPVLKQIGHITSDEIFGCFTCDIVKTRGNNICKHCEENQRDKIKEDYLNEIREMPEKEVKEYVKKKLGRANTLDCEHKETIVITMERCVDCKKTVKYEEG